MFAHRATVVLAPEAQDDVEHILLYGREQWGDDQADRYVERPRSALRRLAGYPFIGPARPDLFSGARICTVGQHRIVYRVDGALVEVVRILHVRADAASRFADEDDDPT